MERLHLRLWATPLVAAAFLVMGVTGALMFFHAAPGLATGVHEWAGWLLLVGAGLHVAINWRPALSYLRRPVAQVILAAGIALLGFSMIPSAETGRPDVAAIAQGLSDVPLSSLANLTHQPVAEVLDTLAAAGTTATADQTVADIAGGDVGARLAILSTVFAEGEATGEAAGG